MQEVYMQARHSFFMSREVEKKNLCFARGNLIIEKV